MFNRRKKLFTLFAAHAPEPPPFFAIEADGKQPSLPEPSTIKEDADREKATAWIQSQGVMRPENPSEDLLGFMTSYERAMKALLLWQTEQQERLYFAWRRGYALKMTAIAEAIK